MTPIANPEMLALARESRGLSQKELAGMAGVSQGYVSKGETGLLEVTGERLEQLAVALDYPIEFFVQREHKFGVEALFHRRLRTVKVGELKQIQAAINVWRMQAKRLLQGVEIDSPHTFPRLDVDDVGGPERAAQLVRRAWGLPLGPVSSVVGSIEAAGGVVMPVVLNTSKVSAAAQWPLGEDRPFFFVNAGHPGDRQRFSLSHEIGHMVLHAAPEEEQEEQADRFASEFLMPETEIRPQLKGRLTPARLAELKRYWKVSMAALVKRANQLGIITKERMSSLYKMLSAKGWRVVEPVPIAVEKPELLGDVLRTHVGEHGYTVDDLGRLALMSPHELTQTFPMVPSAGRPEETHRPERRLRAVE